MGSFWSGIKNSFIKFRGILTLNSSKCSIKRQYSFLWRGSSCTFYSPAVKGTLWTSIGIGVKFICQTIKNIKVHYGPELELDFVREVD